MSDPDKLDNIQPQGNSYEAYSLDDALKSYNVVRSSGDTESGWYGVGEGIKGGIPFTRVIKSVENPFKPGSGEMITAEKDISTDKLKVDDERLRAERINKAMGQVAYEQSAVPANGAEVSPDPVVERSADQQRIDGLKAVIDDINAGLSQEDQTNLWRYAAALDHEPGRFFDNANLSGNVTREMADKYRAAFLELQEARKALG